MFAKLLVVVTMALLAWAVVASGSDGAGRGLAYTVRPHDTLWSIAAARYGGDPREAIWKIERRNHLAGPLIRPGQLLVLP